MTRAQSSSSERRLHRRTKVSLPVRVTVRGRPHMGFTVSISTGGMRVKTDAPCLPHERVEIQMLLESAPMQAQAEVVRLSSVEVAFRFVGLDLNVLRAINVLMSGATAGA